MQTSEKCTKYFSYFESKHQLPEKLLQSVSLTETGRWHSETKQMLPWPWAVNQGGKSFYFDTKHEAVRAVSEMIDSGITNIDVGCMQVNLGYHSGSFNNLLEAFEPRHNINYGAEILKGHYTRFSSWEKAIGAYHSMSDLGAQYYKKVKQMWKREIPTTSNDLKAARKNYPKFYHTRPRKNPERLRSSLVVK